MSLALPWMIAGLWCASATAAPLDAVRVTVFNEAIAVPYTSLPVRRLHPGLAVSASLVRGGRGAFDWTFDAELAGYTHPGIETAVMVVPSWRPTVWLHRVFGLSGLVGLGYKHSFATQPTYVLRDGTYTRRASAGRPEATAQIGTGITVRASDRLAVLVQYRGGVDGPFSSSLGMPMMFHNSLHVGLEVRR